jgi:hypothetical protein
MGTRSIGFLLTLVLVLAIGSMIDLAWAQSGNRATATLSITTRDLRHLACGPLRPGTVGHPPRSRGYWPARQAFHKFGKGL